MPSYFAPGVYVEEVPSGIQPIAGVGTSTAGFVGLAPTSAILTSNVLIHPLAKVESGRIDLLAANLAPPPGQPALPAGETSYWRVRQVWVKDPASGVAAPIPAAGWEVENRQLVLKGAYRAAATARLDYVVRAAYALDANKPGPLPQRLVVRRELATWNAKAGQLAIWDGSVVQPTAGAVEIALPDGPVDAGQLAFMAGSADVTARFDAASRVLALDGGTLLALADGDRVTGSYVVLQPGQPAQLLAPQLCTSFSDFKRGFGDFSSAAEQNRLAHAVFGFFNNGGSRCWVVQAATEGDVAAALDKLGLIDEIALVAAPGLTSRAVYGALTSHCENLGDRFGLLDCPEQIGTTDGADNLARLDPTLPGNAVPANSHRVAFYFPWIEVFDPPSQLADPGGEGSLAVPPSGHLAGLYARVDRERGVHKAPANEVVRGALGLPVKLTRPQQAGLNPHGINVIRELNNQILVWGARTLGGDANGEWKYVNVRRLLLFLEESIDEGTQWVVFEPNQPALWAKVARNVTAFLTNVWRSGALFGATPQEAFYVKCDAETNPPDVRERGQVIAEVGVAPVRPAEFVIFRVQQFTGSTGK